jgi:exosortase D (VPLPA-CTERM-specific)
MAEYMNTHNAQKYILPGLIGAVYLLAFIPVFEKLGVHWNQGDNSYCYLVVPLFLYLCWEKRAEFYFDQFSWSPWGIALVLLSILCLIAGELGSMETLLYIGVWGCVVGVLVILYGLRLRQLIFPVLILAFIVPMPPFINRMLTFNLKLAASTLSVLFMQLAGISVFQDGNIIDIGITQLQVVDACSGLRYFVPLILMALLFGYFYCRRLWPKIVLLLVVPPLSIVVNGLRIFVTGKLHLWGHAELAEDFFHDFSGWLVFMIAGALLFGTSMVLKRFGPQGRGAVEPAVDTGAKAVPSMVPMALTVVLCVVFAGTGWALQKLPSSANLPARKSFEAFPMVIDGWQAKRHYLSDDILNSLWADDYLSATYSRRGLPNKVQMLIPFYEYQGTRHTAHAPQSCMLGGGWAMLESGERVMTTTSGIDLQLRTIIWQKGDTRLLGSYFFFQRGRVITSPWMNKYWLMVDAFTKRRTDGALVRVEMTLSPGQSLDEAYTILESFVGEVLSILPQYVPV